MYTVSLGQKRFRHKGKPTTIKIGLSLTESIGVQLSFARKDLPKPKNPAKALKWAATITGVLFWCFLFPPKVRRRQFIVYLGQSPSVWLPPEFAPSAQGLSKLSRDLLSSAEKQSVVWCHRHSCQEQQKSVVMAALGAFESRLPAKLTVRFAQGTNRQVSAECLTSMLAPFALRLFLWLAMTGACYGQRWRSRGLSQDSQLTWWVGASAATAYYILKEEMRNRDSRSPDVQTILLEALEASRYQGFQSLNSDQEQCVGATAYVVARAFRSVPGIRRLKSVAPFLRTEPDFLNLDSFYTTLVQPYTRKLGSLLTLLAEWIRPLLFGPPGALTKEIGYRPKSTL